MPRQQTDADEVGKAPDNAGPHKRGSSEAASPQTTVRKEKEAADRTHMTVKAKPDPSPHKVRKP